MTDFLSNTLTVVEWLAVMGLVQTVLILVYIVFRVHSWRQAGLALVYFVVLALSFCLQFALRIEDYNEDLRFLLWLCRGLSPPLCYLLVLQVARGDVPALRQFWVPAFVALALAGATALGHVMTPCRRGAFLCEDLFGWLSWTGALAGGVAMLALWAHKDLFASLRRMKGGAERYWLVIVLVVANVGLLIIGLLSALGSLETAMADALFAVMSLALVYLSTTLLFRIYPAPVTLSPVPTRFTSSALTEEEKAIAARVKTLMEVDKLYHEPSFSRTDLARELNVPENTLSRVVNVSFGKSVPRLLNEFRVEDAKRMLKDPAIPVQVVATEVGFNSLASFNRAFKEIAGVSPTQFREP